MIWNAQLMKIVYITNECPWPPTTGSRQRHFQIINRLSRTHDVKVVSLTNAPSSDIDYPDNVEFIPIESDMSPWVMPQNRLRRWSEQAQRTFLTLEPEEVMEYSNDCLWRVFQSLRRLTASADAVWVSRAFYGHLAHRARLNRRLIVDFHEVSSVTEAGRFQKTPWSAYKFFRAIDLAKFYLFEQTLARRVWRCVVCKPEDREFFNARRNVYVVPNGTSVRQALPVDDEQAGRMLFVGLMSFSPNVDAVTWFVRDSLPLVKHSWTGSVNAILDVVGSDPPDVVRAFDDGACVRVHGFVPDLVDYYRKASVVVAPLRFGGGTKLKVLEALSYGKALVATSEAVKGLQLRHGIDVEVADTPADFAAACSRLLNDPSARARMGESGRARVNALFSWDRIGSNIDRVVVP
jgi:glycosyltransferase involved in cell wall biosynthesis